MKSKEEFEVFGREYLLPQLRRLERRRRYLLIKILMTSIVLLLLIIIPSMLPVHSIPLIYLPAIIAFIFLVFACDDLLRKYPAAFKNTVTRKILTFIDPSLTYSSKEGIIKKDFQKCNLFDSHIERYESSNLIKGKIGKTDIQLSYIKADRSRDNNESEIFRGLFIIIGMNKDFQGQTLVCPNYAEKYLGYFGKILNRIILQAGEHIQLENPEFNQTFIVHSNNPIEARYILTPGLMERMLDIRKDLTVPCFSFTQSKIYIAVKNFPNIINPNIILNMTDFESCFNYFNKLQNILNIVEDLNLNTRIWSKE